MNPGTVAYIAIGSNLGDPLAQVELACATLSQHRDLELLAVSPWYRSKAVGPGVQPDYINGVASLRTTLAPLDLLALLQAIEQKQGRERKEHWGPRTLDLDLLLYGNHVIDNAQLQVPHPRMERRNFVLQPLSDLAPDLCLPNGRKIKQLLAALDGADLCRI